jgi:hypothetical protein
MGDYCKIDDVKAYLTGLDIDIVTEDPEIQRFLERSKDQIERSTRMKFESTALVERYDGKGQSKLVLNHFPLIALTYAKIFNQNNALIRTLAEADVIPEKQIGCITIPPAMYWLSYWPYTPYIGPYAPALQSAAYDYYNRFGIGIANIEVSYTYGYANPPNAIKDACIKMVVIELLKKKGISISQGASNINMTGVSEAFSHGSMGGGTGPFGHIIGELQQDIESDLALYRSRPLRVI